MHSYTVYRENKTMWHELPDATCLPKPPVRLDCPCECIVPAIYPLDFRLC